MATFEFKLPDIGEGVVEGEIVAWLVAVGDDVAEDQEMVEVMTDKATVTIGAPKAGRVSRLGGDVGQVIPVGGTLLVLDLGGGASASEGAAPEAPRPAPVAPSPAPAPRAPAPQPAASVAKPASTEVVASAVGDIRDSLPGMGVAAPTAPRVTTKANGGAGYYNEKPVAAPAIRKLARELRVDLRQVEPTGSSGRVTREDVERAASRSEGARTPAREVGARRGDEAQVAAPARDAPARAPAVLRVPAGEERRVPIRGLRKRIYENMARSKHTAAHFTYVDECDASALKALRERTKSAAEAMGVKLSFLPFIVKAVVAALKKHPTLNCLVDDAAQEMILRGSYDIGIAAATDSGLIVPVLRNADQRSLLDTAREIDRLAQNARSNKTRQEDLGGSGFTITSLGKLGGLFATPIVNYPEVAILGVHEMKAKPVVRDGRVEAGFVMLLSLSFDHRIIDGHVGAAFAREIIDYLETPERLLLEMA